MGCTALVKFPTSMKFKLVQQLEGHPTSQEERSTRLEEFLLWRKVRYYKET
jgi:hypothetical protein